MSFAINKTSNTLVLKGGYVTITQGGFIKVFQADKDHPHFQDAEARGWIEYSEHAPTYVPEAPKIEIATSLNDLHGMTESQLLAELDKDNAEKAKVEVTSIGAGEDVTKEQPTPEATTEVATEVPPEVETKPAKKTRASKSEPTTETQPDTAESAA